MLNCSDVFRRSIVLLLAVVFVLGAMAEGAHAEKASAAQAGQQAQAGQEVQANYVNQEGYCLEKYKTKDYVVTKNPKWNFVKKAKYVWWNKLLTALGAKGLFYKSKKGEKAKFRRWLRFDLDNPQSIAVTPDGSTMFIMSTTEKSASREYERQGYIWKVDLKGLKSDPVVAAQVARDGYIYVDAGDKNVPLREPAPYYSGDPVDDADYAYRKYVTHSQPLVTGHGQTMAYNPKTRKLWYLPLMKQMQCRAVCVDPVTLTQEAVIDFRLKSSIKCPSTLTFDKNGNAFFYMKSSGSKWAPKDTAKIYKGSITPTEVKFSLIMKGIRYAPGTVVQSMGYNPKKNRLYLISDRSILTVPVSKMNKSKRPEKALLPDDIKASIFKFSREFEGIAYDKAGNGYFLTNKPDEVMLVNKGF